jgi:hypothetical protein
VPFCQKIILLFFFGYDRLSIAVAIRSLWEGSVLCSDPRWRPRIDPWWNQSVYKSSLDSIWLKSLFPKILLAFIYILLFVLVYFLDKSILLLVPLIILALIEPFFIKHYLSILLKENGTYYKMKLLDKKIKQKIMIDLFIVSLFITVFFIEINWFYIAFSFYCFYTIVYYLYLSFKFFPKSIVEINKQRIDSIKRQKNNSNLTQ